MLLINRPEFSKKKKQEDKHTPNYTCKINKPTVYNKLLLENNIITSKTITFQITNITAREDNLEYYFIIQNARSRDVHPSFNL